MNNITSKKEFHIVTINGLNVNIKMSVNGFVIFSEDLEGSVSIAGFKLNPFLIGGDNKIEITATMIPNEYNNTSCNFPFGVADLSVSNTISYDPNKLVSGKDLTDKGVENFTYTIHADIPYTPAWAQSEMIGKDAITQKKILDKYKEFHRLLEQKDLGGIMKFSDVKIENYLKSTYDSDFESTLKNSLKEQFAGSDQLIGIDVQEKNGLQYEYYYGDRLVSIKNDENRSIIMYYDNETGVTTQYPLFFYFDGKDFVLIL